MDIKPQVGDVLNDYGCEYEVFKVNGSSLLLASFKRLGDKISYQGTPYWETNAPIIDTLVITHRDGKPYKPERVFEEGYTTMYEAIFKGERTCVHYLDGFFYIPATFRKFKESDFDWIGEKLDIDWPEVKSCS